MPRIRKLTTGKGRGGVKFAKKKSRKTEDKCTIYVTTWFRANPQGTVGDRISALYKLAATRRISYGVWHSRQPIKSVWINKWVFSVRSDLFPQFNHLHSVTLLIGRLACTLLSQLSLIVYCYSYFSLYQFFSIIIQIYLYFLLWISWENFTNLPSSLFCPPKKTGWMLFRIVLA